MPKMGYGQFDIVRVNAGGGHYLLLPALTTTQRNALTAETGMTIFNSTTGYVENYDGSNWVATGKAYGDATFLKLAGGTMAGAIAMGTNKITGMGDPSAAQDAATKTYTDDAIDTDVATHAALTATHGVSGTIADADDLTAHEADLDAHTRNYQEIVRTGAYYFPPLCGAGATRALVANILYASPLIIARDVTIDRLAIEVRTGDSGKVARIGIYNDGTNLYPGSLVLDAGEISVASTGIIAATISQSLTKGLYWVAVVSDGTPTLRSSSMYWTPYGCLADFNGISGRYQLSHTYGALPDPYTAGATASGASCYLTLPRIASLD